MQADKEVMVMQAIGMSNKSIMKPAFILAIGLTIIGYLLTLSIIPASHRELGELKWHVRNDLSHLLLQEGQFNTLNNRLTLYVKERAEDGSVKGVLAYDAKNPKNISVLIAEKGFIFQNDEGFDLVSGWKEVRNDPWEKRLPSKFFNKVTSIVSGIFSIATLI